jgi:hypothetical protein
MGGTRKDDGTECWAFGGSSDKHGDGLGLPVRVAPLLPEVTLAIENRTYAVVEYVRIRGKGETGWGSNRLGGGHVSHGEVFTLAITAGFYNILLQDHWGSHLLEMSGSDIGAEPSTRNLVFGGRHSFPVRNSTAFPICMFSLQPNIGGEMVDLAIPGDGTIAIGEQVILEALIGNYTYFAHRCSDGPMVATHNLYIYPGCPVLVIS